MLLGGVRGVRVGEARPRTDAGQQLGGHRAEQFRDAGRPTTRTSLEESPWSQNLGLISGAAAPAGWGSNSRIRHTCVRQGAGYKEAPSMDRQLDNARAPQPLTAESGVFCRSTVGCWKMRLRGRGAVYCGLWLCDGCAAPAHRPQAPLPFIVRPADTRRRRSYAGRGCAPLARQRELWWRCQLANGRGSSGITGPLPCSKFAGSVAAIVSGGAVGVGVGRFRGQMRPRRITTSPELLFCMGV